jgi:hypothetical protein
MSIIKKLSLTLATLLSLFAMVPNLALADTSSAIKCGVNGAAGKDCSAAPSGTSSLDSTAKTIINFLAILVGIAAIIMIIFAGFKYITSAGDAEKIKSAKNTLVYAIVGLVLVALAETIVHFVLTEAKTPSTTSLIITRLF